MQITQASLDALRVTFDASFKNAYEKAPSQWQELAMTMPSSTKRNVYGWLAQQVVMREWIGPREVQALAERKFEVENRKFEATIKIPVDELDDAGEGDLATYTNIQIPQLGVAAADKVDIELVKLIQDPATLTFDGQPLFDPAHPTFARGGGVYNNVNALALTPDNVNTIWANGPQIPGEDGEVQAIIYDSIIVPPQLRRPALEAMQATQVVKNVENAAFDSIASTSIDNVMQGWMNVIVMPRLANEPTTWYMAKLGGPVKPFIMQDRLAPTTTARMSPEDPEVFDNDNFLWGAKRRFAVAPSIPFLIQKSVG